MENKVLATHWVVAYGVDCDGFNSGHVAPFANRKEAEDYLENSIRWSDGLDYVLIDSLEELEEYCYYYGKRFINYTKI